MLTLEVSQFYMDQILVILFSLSLRVYFIFIIFSFSFSLGDDEGLWRNFSFLWFHHPTFSGHSHFTYYSQHPFSCWYKLLSQSAPDFLFLSTAVYSKSSVIILWVVVLVIVFPAPWIFHFFFLLFPFVYSICCKVDCIPDVTNFCEGLYAVHFLGKSQLGCSFLVGCLCRHITQQRFLFLLPTLLFLSPAILIITIFYGNT